MKSRELMILSMVSLLLVASGCHSFQDRMGTQIMPEEELYQLGIQKFNEGRWDEAIAVFERFERLYVNSDKVQEIRLKRADAYFNKDRRSSFILAKSEYQGFVALYPRYEDSAYVWKQIAICSFKQILPPNRDQTQTEESIKDFQTFLQKYPDSKYVPEVREQLQQAYTNLAEHHVVVGMHYFGRRLYPAAAERLKKSVTMDVTLQDPESVLYYLAYSMAMASEDYRRIHDFALKTKQIPEADRYRQLYESTLYEAKQYFAEYKEKYPGSAGRIAAIERAINAVSPLTPSEPATVQEQ
jgi:outer membrane protein assembly factor BamD